MSAKIIHFETENGPLFIEAQTDSANISLANADGDAPVSKAMGTFESSIKSLQVFSGNVIKAFINVKKPDTPHEIELEFGIKFSTDIDAWIIKGTAEGDIRLTLKWKGHSDTAQTI